MLYVHRRKELIVLNFSIKSALEFFTLFVKERINWF